MPSQFNMHGHHQMPPPASIQVIKGNFTYWGKSIETVTKVTASMTQDMQPRWLRACNPWLRTCNFWLQSWSPRLLSVMLTVTLVMPILTAGRYSNYVQSAISSSSTDNTNTSTTSIVLVVVVFLFLFLEPRLRAASTPRSLMVRAPLLPPPFFDGKIPRCSSTGMVR
jgi:hypothetical protein